MALPVAVAIRAIDPATARAVLVELPVAVVAIRVTDPATARGVLVALPAAAVIRAAGPVMVQDPVMARAVLVVLPAVVAVTKAGDPVTVPGPVVRAVPEDARHSAVEGQVSAPGPVAPVGRVRLRLRSETAKVR